MENTNKGGVDPQPVLRLSEANRNVWRTSRLIWTSLEGTHERQKRISVRDGFTPRQSLLPELLSLHLQEQGKTAGTFVGLFKPVGGTAFRWG